MIKSMGWSEMGCTHTLVMYYHCMDQLTLMDNVQGFLSAQSAVTNKPPVNSWGTSKLITVC